MYRYLYVINVIHSNMCLCVGVNTRMYNIGGPTAAEQCSVVIRGCIK